MNALIVGGSSGLGRRLAEEAARTGANLILLASDSRDLAAIASDLSLRYGVRCEFIAADVATDEHYLQQLEELVQRSGPLSSILFPIGSASDEDRIGASNEVLDRLVRVNFLAPVSIVSRLQGYLDPAGASIVGFGSIAQIRGRGANVAYSAAKRALASYFESLRHGLSSRNIAVQFYVVGYLDTPQTHGRRTLLPKANAQRFARRVVARLGRDVGVTYYPAYWRWVALALRFTPWFLFRRLHF